MPKNLTPFQFEITLKDRNILYGHNSLVVWITGLSGAGKSTLANSIEKELFQQGIKTMILDGDNVRNGLNNNLGFTTEDRTENIRRIAETAKLFLESGTVVIASFISPFEENRRTVRSIVGEENYFEIFVNTPLEICEKRDPKGLYEKARKGELKEFTGVTSPYEIPIKPNFTINTASTEFTTKLAELNAVLRNKITLHG